MIQQTLVLIKPDGIQKGLIGPVMTKLSGAGLELIAAKMVQVSRELAVEHYQHLQDKPFFPELIQFLQGELHQTRKVLAMVFWGEEAITKIREVAGATNPEDAAPQSIRGAFGRVTTKGVMENVVHASSSEDEAEREIKLWFHPDELLLDLYPSKLVSASESKRVWASAVPA